MSVLLTQKCDLVSFDRLEFLLILFPFFSKKTVSIEYTEDGEITKLSFTSLGLWLPLNLKDPKRPLPAFCCSCLSPAGSNSCAAPELSSVGLQPPLQLLSNEPCLCPLRRRSLANLKEDDENMDLPLPAPPVSPGPSRTVVGEGVLVIMLDSTIVSLGGSSRHLLTVVVVGWRMRSVQGRGLPGCSSHRKGTEAEV